MRRVMSGAPSGPWTVRSSMVTWGFTGSSIAASMEVTAARRWTMSPMALKPPGSTCSSWSSGMRDSGSIRSRRDMVLLKGVVGKQDSGREDEALIAARGDLVALLAVLADTAGVGHEHARLTGH